MKNLIMNSLGEFKSVCNLDGKPNQYVLRFENGRIFQSYESIIVVEFFYNSELPENINNKIFLGEDWNYSRTTSKYRNMFMNRDLKWCRDAIKDGSIQVVEGL